MVVERGSRGKESQNHRSGRREQRTDVAQPLLLVHLVKNLRPRKSKVTQLDWW